MFVIVIKIFFKFQSLTKSVADCALLLHFGSQYVLRIQLFRGLVPFDVTR